MSTGPRVLILLPAAGASSRMRGRDKLLEPVRGQPLLRDRVAAALDLGLDVAVTLPPDRPERADTLRDLVGPRLHLMTVNDAATGMSASLRAGADRARAGGYAGLMVVLPDLPDLLTQDLKTVLQANDSRSILRATSQDGRAGHPVIFPADVLPTLARLTGDDGARDILRTHPVRHLALPDTRATTDLDTPEAWATWRARNGG
ncbi:nucleotidyltransferase family protein [Roseovarius tibetensis]|uniref:nucleotidyltransferase family protein n=1 Tax=Roseovarius tibetensis TaxID=2685897 RepID=UPI003D7F456C